MLCFCSWVSIASHVVHLFGIMPSYWLFRAKLIWKNTVKMTGNVQQPLWAHSVHTCVRAFQTERHVSNQSFIPFECNAVSIAPFAVIVNVNSIIVFIIIIVSFSHLPRYLRIYSWRVCETHTGNVYLEFVPFNIPVGCHTPNENGGFLTAALYFSFESNSFSFSV